MSRRTLVATAAVLPLAAMMAPAPSRQIADLAAEWWRIEREIAALAIDMDVPPGLDSAQTAVMTALTNTPAASIVDIAEKLRIAVSVLFDDGNSIGDYDQLIIDAANAAARLTGGVS
jgi:hypothetical protein